MASKSFAVSLASGLWNFISKHTYRVLLKLFFYYPCLLLEKIVSCSNIIYQLSKDICSIFVVVIYIYIYIYKRILFLVIGLGYRPDTYPKDPISTLFLKIFFLRIYECPICVPHGFRSTHASDEIPELAFNNLSSKQDSAVQLL